MIDFVKIKILYPDIDNLRALSFLKWERPVNDQTGEINTEKPITAKFNGLTIDIFYDKYVYVRGSLHYYWNITKTGKRQNYNDFTFSSLAWTIRDICTRFNLDPVNCKIENIETGVNIISPIPVNEVLRSIINHKGKPFTQEHNENKYFRECEHQRYFVKVYNKGLQFEQPENILRFELKYVKMKDLKPCGIKTLADLTEKDKINSLVELLQAHFNDLLFYDSTIQENDLPQSERAILTQGRIPTYWNELKETNPENYKKKKKRFRELVNRYGKQNLQETIRNLITQKWNDLLQTDPETFPVLTGGAIHELTDPANMDFPHFNPLYIELKQVNSIQVKDSSAGITPRRYCQTCGRDISDQKKGAKFCSAKIVGYENAHKCRNDNSNPWNNLKNIIERDNERGLLFLFDTLPYFVGGNRRPPQIIQ